MATAPTLVAAYAATQTISSGVNETSPSLTLQAGDIVTVIGVNEGGESGSTINTCSTTFVNGGITLLQSHTATNDCTAAAWTFTVSTNGSGTVSIKHTATTAQNQVLAVFAHRGGVASTVGRSSLGTGASRTLGYSSSQPNSSIVWALGDWAQGATQTPIPTSTAHTITTPGPTAIPQSGSAPGAYAENVATIDDWPLTSSTLYGINGSGTGPFTIIVVEIQGASTSPVAPVGVAQSGSVTPAASSATVTLATGVGINDLDIFAVNVQATGVSLITPSGWNLLGTASESSGVVTGVFWRLRQSGDPTTVTVPIIGSTSLAGWDAWAYTKTHQTSPFGAVVTGSDVVSDTTLNTGPLTTLKSNSYEVMVSGIGSGSTSFTSPPAGLTTLIQSTGGGKTVAVAHAPNTAPTTTAASSWTTSLAARGTYLHFEVLPEGASDQSANSDATEYMWSFSGMNISDGSF